MRCVISILIFMCSLGVGAQDLLRSRQTSYSTLIFTITNDQAKKLHEKGKVEIDSSFFVHPVASYPTDSSYQGELEVGHYLRVYTRGSQLQIDYSVVQDFDVKIFNNSADLVVSVFDRNGKILSDARVKVGLKHLRFDAQTQTYRDKKSNKRGLLEVSHHGLTSFYQLSRNYDNSLVRRIYRRVAFGTPVRYVWRPVDFVISIPIDGIKSLVRTYPTGTIYRLSRAPQNLYRRIACLFDSWHCDEWRFSRKYKGYLAFSKPKYMPGDTVKFKAFITKNNGKPLRKPVSAVLNGAGKFLELGTLYPYGSGGYTKKFVLGDTLDLKLDKSYAIEINDKHDRRYLYESFIYEDYELTKVILQINGPEKDHYRGDTIELKVNAKDENQLPVLDGQLEVLITADRVHDIFSGALYIPDTLSYFEQPLNPDEETIIEIPDAIFPDVNMHYKVQVTMLTSDNERLTEVENLVFFEKREVFDYELQGDSISFSYLVNGKVKNRLVEIRSFDRFGNQVMQKQKRLPFSTHINPFYFQYQLVDMDSILLDIEISEEDAGIQISAIRTKDSISINAINPRNIPIVYYLYKENHEIERGRIDQLTINLRAHSDANYHLSTQYVWGGSVMTNNYEIPLEKNQLNVTYDAPKVVSPGQEVSMTVNVTDYRGRPVADVDVLAHGLTGKFKSRPVSLPNYDSHTRERTLINTFNLASEPDYEKNRTMEYDRWNPLMALDSMAFYQFLYPDSLYEFSYISKDSITQFAPFVVKDGIIQPVGVVYVDGVPVYFSWMADQPYSFAVDSGVHTIKIRTPSKEYVLEDQFFAFGHKTIISINEDRLPSRVESYAVNLEYSKREVSNLSRYVMPFRYTFDGAQGFIRQEDRYLSIKPNVRPYVIGPMRNRITYLKMFENFEMQFDYEECFEYEFRVGVLKMRSKKPEDLIPKYVANSARDDFGQEVYTEKQLMQEWENELLKRRLTSRRYDNPKATSAKEGKLVFKYLSEETDVLNTLFLKLDDPDFLRVYPKNPSVVHGLNEGYYKVIYLLSDSLYVEHDSIPVKVYGTTYWVVDLTQSLANLKFTRMVNDQIQSYFKNVRARIGEDEEKDLMRTYQQNFQYFGPGQVVSGVVYDEDSNEALPGVNVVVKGTTYGTVTDLDGRYSLRVPYDRSTLVISFIGMSTEEISIYSASDVYMKADVQQLQEVVVVGYGVENKRSLSSAVSVVSGRVAGVNINDSENIQIRGVSSVSSDLPPLIVIDGVIYQGDLSSLDLDIASVQVLKSDEMTGLYGLRASNGVIIIDQNKINSQQLSRLTKLKDTSPFEQGSEKQYSLRSNFSDEAFWRPSLRTNADGEATFRVKFPDDVTSWDAYVYAINGKQQTGMSSTLIKSYKTLSAQLSMPRFGVVGDSIWVIGKALNYTADTVEVSTLFEFEGNRQAKNHTLYNSQIDSLLIHVPDQDSLSVKYLLTRKDGYYDGELRKLPVYPVGVKKEYGYFAALRGDTILNWHFPDTLGAVRIQVMGPSKDSFKSKLSALIEYPYGCNEQLASKLKALLLLDDLDAEMDLKRVRVKKINQIIKKLESNQNSDGLWGWWNQSSGSFWISVHVAEALQKAQLAGYEVTIDKTKIADEAAWYLSGDEIDQAVNWLQIAQCFGIKLNYEVFASELEQKALNQEAYLRLQLVKQRMGRSVDAAWIVSNLETDQFGKSYFLDTAVYRSFFTNKEIQNTALALHILSRDSANGKAISAMQDYLFEKVASNYLNTFLLSNTLESLIETLPDFQNILQSEVIINGQQFSENQFDSIYNHTGYTISKSGRWPVYVSGSQAYWDHNPRRDSSSFTVFTRFEKGDSQLEAGDPEKIIVTLEVRNNQEYVMVEVPIPAGCSYQSKGQSNAWEVHREYFREKVSIFCRELPKGIHQFEVEVLPRYAGKFTLNPAKAEQMYFPVFMGHEEVKRVIIE